MLILFIDSTMANIKLNLKSEIYMKPDAFSDSKHFLPLRRDLLKKKNNAGNAGESQFGRPQSTKIQWSFKDKMVVTGLVWTL